MYIGLVASIIPFIFIYIHYDQYIWSDEKDTIKIANTPERKYQLYYMTSARSESQNNTTKFNQQRKMNNIILDSREAVGRAS